MQCGPASNLRANHIPEKNMLKVTLFFGFQKSSELLNIIQV